MSTAVSCIFSLIFYTSIDISYFFFFLIQVSFTSMALLRKDVKGQGRFSRARVADSSISRLRFHESCALKLWGERKLGVKFLVWMFNHEGIDSHGLITPQFKVTIDRIHWRPSLQFTHVFLELLFPTLNHKRTNTFR